MGDRSAEAKDLEDEGDEDVVSEVGRGLGMPMKSHDENIVLAVAANRSFFIITARFVILCIVIQRPTVDRPVWALAYPLSRYVDRRDRPGAAKGRDLVGGSMSHFGAFLCAS